jgi:hypothetical protein
MKNDSEQPLGSLRQRFKHARKHKIKNIKSVVKCIQQKICEAQVTESATVVTGAKSGLKPKPDPGPIRSRAR